jgi:hypothetical protein
MKALRARYRPAIPAGRHPLLNCFALALSGALACVAACGASAETTLNARTSWIGNTYGFGDGTWTQIDITALAVAPDGTVYTNAPWDESGAEASIYKDGKMLGFAGGTHGWGNGGGNAIAINSRYVYVAVAVDNEHGRLVGQGIWPEQGRKWFGISRRERTDPKRSAPFEPPVNRTDPRARLAASFLMVNEVPSGTSAEVTGLAATETRLYASNRAHDRIEVYDSQSLMRKSSWPVHAPGHLALDRDGTLWAITETRSARPQVAHFTADGKPLNDTLPLPDDTVATDVAVDAQGRVLIADNGPRQQVLFFSKSKTDGRYRASGTLGERGGIYAGVAGRPGPQRFNGLTGVGVDAHGNVYVASNGIGPRYDAPGLTYGATLDSYTPDGQRRWQVQGLLFVDGASMDPARPDSVYTGNKRFTLDFSQPAGHEWQYAGFLSNRFRYPDDPVFYAERWPPGLPFARKLDGHTFLFTTDMYADHLKIYRFDTARDGETAIPAGFVATDERAVAQVPNAPGGGEWIWRDANGNGKFDSNEFEVNSTGKPLAGGWGWYVDSAGDLWRARNGTGLYRLRFGGLDSNGNPLYSYAKMDAWPVPQPFNDVRRVVYEPATDSLYAAGYTPQAGPDRAYWKEAGRVLVRYDRWSSGKPVVRYTITLPWITKPKPGSTIIGIAVEGKYIFAVEPVGTVHVYDKDSGTEIGVLKPGPEVGRASGFIDVSNGISAYRRSNGEYLVFVEEDARGKVMMYRWKPAR